MLNKKIYKDEDVNTITWNYDINKDFSIINVHFYWNGTFTDKNLLCLYSFICTQKSYLYKIIIWTKDKDFNFENDIIKDKFLKLQKNYNIEINIFNVTEQLNFNLENKKIFNISQVPKNPRSFSDFVRFIVLYNYGGLYCDFDTCFLKDLNVLFKYSFVYYWDKFTDKISTACFFVRKKDVITKILSSKDDLKENNFYHPLNFNISKFKDDPDIEIYPGYIFDPAWNNIIDWKTNFKEYEKISPFDAYFIIDSNTDIPIDMFSKNSYAYSWHGRWKLKIHNTNSWYNRFLTFYENKIKDL